jgi:hypothetical protein
VLAVAPLGPRFVWKTGARVAPITVSATQSDSDAAAVQWSWVRARDVLSGVPNRP